MTAPLCARPIAAERLLEYWLRELSDTADGRVEEHLFGCVQCTDALQELLDLGAAVRASVRRGVVGAVINDTFVWRLMGAGLRVREYRVPAGGRVDCTVTAEDDLLVSYLEGDFRGVSRLDLVVQVEDGPEHRVFDLPISPSSPELIVAQAMPALRAMPSSTMRMRLLAREGEGDRLVGEYTFAHLASGSGRE